MKKILILLFLTVTLQGADLNSSAKNLKMYYKKDFNATIVFNAKALYTGDSLTSEINKQADAFMTVKNLLLRLDSGVNDEQIHIFKLMGKYSHDHNRDMNVLKKNKFKRITTGWLIKFNVDWVKVINQIQKERG